MADINDDLPDLRAYIRWRRAALAGFMQQGAALKLDGDLLKIKPRSEIYVRYLHDNLAVGAALASEMHGLPICATLIKDGALDQQPKPNVNTSADTAAPTIVKWKESL